MWDSILNKISDTNVHLIKCVVKYRAQKILSLLFSGLCNYVFFAHKLASFSNLGQAMESDNAQLCSGLFVEGKFKSFCYNILL